MVQTYYSDNEELVAKLAAGAKGYDVLVPTSNYVLGMAKAGWIQPLDHAKLPNLKNVMPQYRGGAYDPDNKYSAPYAMSITLIGYNEAKIKELGVPVGSWAAIFDPNIVSKLLENPSDKCLMSSIFYDDDESNPLRHRSAPKRARRVQRV